MTEPEAVGVTRKSFLKRTAAGVLIAAPAITALAAPGTAEAYIPCSEQQYIDCYIDYDWCQNGTYYAHVICEDVRDGQICDAYRIVVACC